MAFDAAERLQSLLERPRLWAVTREAYLAQVATLLEVLGHPPEVARRAYRPCLQGNAYVWLDEPLTDEVAAAVRAIVAALPPPPSSSTPDPVPVPAPPA